jgi:hypothetical protein
MSGGKWKAFLSLFAPKPQRARKTQKASFRPRLEVLEDRWVPAGSISGHVFLDPTGNGAAVGDPAQSGVVVKLYQDTNNNGVKDSGDHLVGVAVTAADGSFSFNNLPANTYFVKEVVPGDEVRTGPTLSSYYTVNLSDGQTVDGNDFYNFHKPDRDAVRHISFTILDGSTTATVRNLRGHTQQVDTVTVHFTVEREAGPTQVTLVAYSAPGSTFDASVASQQVIFSVVSGTFDPGTYSISVQLPANFYQVDFVLGDTITQFGPDGSNIFYTPQGRLLSADNGGTNPVAATPATLSGLVTDVNNVPLAGAVLTLTGTNNQGQTITLTFTTDSTGTYSFGNLLPGTYSIQITPPTGFVTVVASPGSLGGTPMTDGVSNIVLNAGDNATGYNFVETNQPF